MRDLKPGDKPPLAYQNVRQFPDWWKPYRFNYNSEGYFIVALSIIMIYGWMYTSDIAKAKGRKE